MPRKKDRSEKAVERHLLVQCRRNGLFCLKFVSPARGGVPDRVVIAPTGTVFVEVKRPDGVLEKRQRLMHSKMRRFGAEIHVVHDESSVDAFIAHVLSRGWSGDPQTRPAESSLMTSTSPITTAKVAPRPCPAKDLGEQVPTASSMPGEVMTRQARIDKPVPTAGPCQGQPFTRTAMLGEAAGSVIGHRATRARRVAS